MPCFSRLSVGSMTNLDRMNNQKRRCSDLRKENRDAITAGCVSVFDRTPEHPRRSGAVSSASLTVSSVLLQD
jgi:hypothetical protein